MQTKFLILRSEVTYLGRGNMIEKSLAFLDQTVSSVQFSHCHIRLFATPWTAAYQASLSITNS